MRRMHRRFSLSDLVLVAPASDFNDPREPPLVIGNRVRLNSGGPVMLVVGVDADLITAAWPGGEAVFPRPCVLRVPS
jgi:hypothetical protein